MTDRSTKNDPRFVEYYAQESLTEKAAERARGIMRAVLQARARTHDAVENLLVADIGCNAGTQSRCWLEKGHRVRGVDIGADLVALATSRNAEFGDRAAFQVASATKLPWESGTFDVALLPELLEHVDDWQSVVNEATRVIKPGGSLFLSTTNVLCPVQQEFALPLYSWYPARLKAHYLRRSLTDAPHLANFATYPAVHWFSPYQLKRYLAGLGVVASDRFDLIDTTHRGTLAKTVLGAVRALPPLRFMAHVATPSTLMYGRKQEPHAAAPR
jgi:2-polyprenyl-3-methyl-5-hydroxy-6-metoxy-1,4-benzoquinol methylase